MCEVKKSVDVKSKQHNKRARKFHGNFSREKVIVFNHRMQHSSSRSNRNKLLHDGMYVIQLNNGEQHYVQASSAVVSAPSTAIALNPSDHMQHTAYLQSHQLEPQLQTIQPQQTTVIHHQTDAFQEVLDFIQHLYTELSKEKHLTHYFCLFCSQEYTDLRLLLRHTSDLHRHKILDGTINLEQDFEAIVRKKIQTKDQQSNTNQQLYQCVQCQQMFNSLEIITEHLNHCQPPQTVTTVVQPQASVESVPSVESVSYQVKNESTPIEIDSSPNHPQMVNIQDPYIPYGCAQCGRRYHTIKDLMIHMRTCSDDTFYDAANHLQHKNWVEAPKSQHIVINEEATNVVLKTTGLWLMPEPLDQQVQSSDSLRGFWVMPSSTSDYLDQQMLQEQQEKQRREQELREQQEKLQQQRLLQEQQEKMRQQRLLQEQQEKLRIQQEQKRLQEQQMREHQEKLRLQREQEEKLLLQRQMIEKQIQEQQNQLILQQQMHQRQQQHSQSVVQTLSSATHSVPLIKSSPASVISQPHPNSSNIQSQRSTQPANTIIVLNDQPIFNHSAGDGLRCIQASDGSYHVIGNVDLSDRQATNTTSVIAHTSPTMEVTQSPLPPQQQQQPQSVAQAPRKKRTRAPKQTTTYTQPEIESQMIAVENSYQSSLSPAIQTQAKPSTRATNSRRKRGAQAIDTSAAMTMEQNQMITQNLESNDAPPQQYYLAYNDNGVLVPIESPSITKNEMHSSGVVDLSHEQYIIEDLDASRKAKQRNRAPSQRTATSTVNHQTATATASTSSSHATSAAVMESNENMANQDLSAYNIDDLSHLDKPIDSTKAAVVTPIKPVKTKPEFMDSFFTFLRNRESNKL